MMPSATPPTPSNEPASSSIRKRRLDIAIEEVDPRPNITRAIDDGQPDMIPDVDLTPVPSDAGGDADMNAIESGSTPTKAGSRSITAVEQTKQNNMSETTGNNPNLSALPTGPPRSSALPAASKGTTPRVHSRPEQKAMEGGLPHDELHWRQIGSGS